MSLSILEPLAVSCMALMLGFGNAKAVYARKESSDTWRDVVEVGGGRKLRKVCANNMHVITNAVPNKHTDLIPNFPTCCKPVSLHAVFYWDFIILTYF